MDGALETMSYYLLATSTTNRAKACGYVSHLLCHFSAYLNEIGQGLSVGVREQSCEVKIWKFQTVAMENWKNFLKSLIYILCMWSLNTNASHVLLKIFWRGWCPLRVEIHPNLCIDDFTNLTTVLCPVGIFLQLWFFALNNSLVTFWTSQKVGSNTFCS